mgnify:CR=1 FL=1
MATHDYKYIGTGDDFKVILHPTVRHIFRGPMLSSLEGGFYYMEVHDRGVPTYYRHRCKRETVEYKLKNNHGRTVDSLKWYAKWVESSHYCPWGSNVPSLRGVYFIEAIGTGLVKIGYAADTSVRIPTLISGTPFPLTLLFVLPGGKSDELQYHRQFGHHHHYNEWFRMEGDLADFIAAHT